MPNAPPHLCATPGCYRLVPRSVRRCPAHQTETQAKVDKRRGSASARGYDRRWRARRARFLREHPLCVDPYSIHPRQAVPATVADHIIPHRGDRELFEDPDNLQPLCAECHGLKTARGE